MTANKTQSGLIDSKLILELKIEPNGELTRKATKLARKDSLEGKLLASVYPGIRVARVSVPMELTPYEQSLVENRMAQLTYGGVEYKLVGASGSAKDGKFYFVDQAHAKSIAEEAQTSTDPAKLYRAIRTCSADAERDIALGFERGAYLLAMCSAHYAYRFINLLETLPPMTSIGSSDMTVATTILEQLGGRRFLVMTGARYLLAHAAALSFQLPSNFAKNGINRVRVDLNSHDLYDVTFSRLPWNQELL